MMIRAWIVGWLVFVMMLFAGTDVYAQFYTGSHQTFGQNRVQYQGFKWQSYNFERFKVHFNGDGKNLAIYAARASHQYLKEFEEYLDIRVEDRLEIVVYNRHSDFRQSNIGLTDDDQTNIGGVTQLVGNKLFVYFDGDHQRFDEQIRIGLAQVMVNHMLHGGNWKDIVRNTAFSGLPDWFVQGFIRYIAIGWNSDADDRVKDAMHSKKFNKFNHLEGEEAVLAGYALWNYIAEKYGSRVVPNVFYIAKASRNVENGFYLVLNMSLTSIANDFLRYYRERYKLDDAHTSEPGEELLSIRTPKKADVYGYRLNAEGSKLAYVTNIMGRYKLNVFDLQKKKRKVIFRAEHKIPRTPDHTFPVLAWHPRMDALAFVIERKGKLQLKIHTFEDGKTSAIELKRLTKVLHMEYAPDGQEIVMSAVADGQSDIYTYRVIGNYHEQLTNDRFDDLYPTYEKGTGRIIFSSDRLSDTLPRKEDPKDFKPMDKDLDLFAIDPNGRGGRKILSRITQTRDENEILPQSVAKGSYIYISDRNGILNRKIAYYDSTISFIDTVVHYRYFTRTANLSNYNRNAREFHVAGQQYGFLNLYQGRYRFYKGELGKDGQMESADLKPTEFRRLELGAMQQQMDDRTGSATQTTVTVPRDSTDGDEIDIDNYRFEDEDPQYEKTIINLEEQISLEQEKKADEQDEFEVPLQKLYKVNFSIDQLVTQFDNNFLNGSYQRYVGPGSVFFNPGFNGLFRVGMTDVFEDYKLAGGFRIGADLRSGEYLLQFEDLSARVDHKYLLYRQSFLNEINGYRVRVKTTEAKYQAKYPISETAAFRATAGFRNDHQIFLAIDNLSLNEDNRNYNMANAKLEFIFDNTVPKGLNLYNGTRLKLFGEYYRELNFDRANIYILGMDIRHYQKVHREIIFATRFSAGTSFGDKKLLHYMGGVDNWMFRPNPNFDTDIQVDQTQNYAFQTIATPMRGFIQNARNGNSFALINAELRVPLVKYFTNRPLRSDFWNNFQVVGFFDIGAAWTGLHPYADDNSFNTTIITQKPLEIIIENQREPVIWGYGLGVRTKLFGYFTRFDWAWGVDDYETQPSIRYFSLTLDF